MALTVEEIVSTQRTGASLGEAQNVSPKYKHMDWWRNHGESAGSVSTADKTVVVYLVFGGQGNIE